MSVSRPYAMNGHRFMNLSPFRPCAEEVAGYARLDVCRPADVPVPLLALKNIHVTLFFHLFYVTAFFCIMLARSNASLPDFPESKWSHDAALVVAAAVRVDEEMRVWSYAR